MDDQNVYLEERTPPQCRNGPIEERSCTDFYCCIFYLLLIGGAVFLSIFAGNAGLMTRSEVQQKLKSEENNTPFLAIIHAIIPIILSLAFALAICLVVVLITFLIPALSAYILIPLFLLLMLLCGVIFICRYVGQKLPLIDASIQEHAAKGDISVLIIGVAFLVGFLAAFITICTKRSKFTQIMPILKIAKTCFWSNCYLLIYSFIFSCISILALFINYLLLVCSQTQKEHLIDPRITIAIIILEILWTHGVIEAASDFFFQSIAIHWYFKRRRQENQEEGCCDNLCLTNKLMFKHIGTIVFGHILAYIPETLNTLLGRCERKCGCLYTTLCFCHRCTFHHLTKYSYIETILLSLSFCPANREMFGLRKRTKSMLSELYMMGNFYNTLTKIFIVMCGIIICYALIVDQYPQVLKSGIYIAGPLVIVFLGSLEISNHYMNPIGLMADTIVFMYAVDVEIEKKNYGEIEPYSCPEDVNAIIRQVKAGNTFIYDE